MKRRPIALVVRTLMAVSSLATATGCGGPPPTIAPSRVTPPSPPAPPPDSSLPKYSVPASTDGGAGVYRLDLTPANRGPAIVILRWGNADVSLRLYVTSGDCPNASSLLAERCSLLGASRTWSPPVAVWSTTLGAGSITIWVVNPDPLPQSVSIDVVVEPGSASPSFHVADVKLSGIAFELTAGRRTPIAGVVVSNGEGNSATTDENGFYTFGPVWICPCAAQPWVEPGTTFVWAVRKGYTYPPDTPRSVFGDAAGLGARDIRIDGDTRFDIELVRTAGGSPP